jgi:hypothetical protein
MSRMRTQELPNWEAKKGKASISASSTAMLA